MELTNVTLDTLINAERMENVLPVSRNFHKRNFLLHTHSHTQKLSLKRVMILSL